ncbi:MAG: hypothetical protein QNJ29_08675 [Rhizobiaceae bacterium]|nr:hypothetical protein [Rhizobiaceae bacterium]
MRVVVNICTAFVRMQLQKLLFLVGFCLCLIQYSHAQVVNGDFSAGGTGWTAVTPGTTDSVTFTGGNLTATSNDIGATTTGPDLQTLGQQTFTAGDAGFLIYTLVSYTDTDIGDFDFPIIVLDGVENRIATDGTIGGTPLVNNDNNITTPISGFTTIAAGSRTIGFGVRTRDSGFGPGVATWDDIDFLEYTLSPAAQVTLENNPLTLSGVNAPQIASDPLLGFVSTVTLTVSNGIINLGSPGSVTITGGADGTSTVTFQGTAAAINTAMAGLVYTPNLNFSGAETLVFTATGGGQTDTDNIPITVTPGVRSITVSKTADAADLINATLGQEINYSYVVTNDGDQVITNVTLNDAHGGSGPAPVPANETLTADVGTPGDSTDAASNGVWDTLGPGDSVTFTATYFVTQSDIDNLQ